MTASQMHATWETTSVESTVALGAALGRVITGGIVIGLIGPLGAGKTHLVKGIASGMGSGDSRKVTSPTFTLIHEYVGRLRLYHIDAYRLRGTSELIALGFDELVGSDSVVAVEWADRVRAAMPADTLWIEMTPTGESSRLLTYCPSGALSRHCVEDLRGEYF